MANAPPAASSLLSSSLLDSIKAYLNFDLSSYTEYEINAREEIQDMHEACELDLTSTPVSAPSTDSASEDEQDGNVDEGGGCDMGDTSTPVEDQGIAGGGGGTGVSPLNLTPLNPDQEYYVDTDEDLLQIIANKTPKPPPLAPVPPPFPEVNFESRDMRREGSMPKMSYTASPHDTLNSIALRFNISPNMLKHINALTSDVIIPGQKLVVPLDSAVNLNTTITATSDHTKLTTPDRKKNFKKYSMKRITRFDGSVVGTTLLTSNAFMFRADVNEPLVIDHGQKNYNVSIPVDTISEILMFEDFDQMLSNIQLDTTISEEDCPKCKAVKSQLHRLSQTDPLDYCSDDEEDDDRTEMEGNLQEEEEEENPAAFDPPRVKIVDPNSSGDDELDGGVVSSIPNLPFDLTSLDEEEAGETGPDLGKKIGHCGSPQLCQHEFIEFSEYSSQYSSLNRVNPFTVLVETIEGKNKLILPNFTPTKGTNDIVVGSLPPSHGPLPSDTSSPPPPSSFHEDASRIKRCDSDASLATQAFFKKIDDNTSKMQTIMENAKRYTYPVFISIHAILCTRTHGKPSFHKTSEHGHKLHYFWFAMTENDTPKIIDNLFIHCSQLDPIQDGSNCLLRCDDNYYKSVKDVILPDAKPTFLPREVDTDLFYESFSGSLNCSPNLKVILTKEMMRQIQPYLPCHMIGINMVLAYSMKAHGMSLRSLYTRCSSYPETPCLLIIKDTQGYLFGGYLSDGILESPKYYGTGETFIFRLYPEPHFWLWQGENHYFMMGTPSYFTVGAGDGNFALYLDEMLQRGTSNRSITFYNEVLGGSASFDILDLEVWVFSDDAVDSETESVQSETVSRYNVPFQPYS